MWSLSDRVVVFKLFLHTPWFILNEPACCWCGWVKPPVAGGVNLNLCGSIQCVLCAWPTDGLPCMHAGSRQNRKCATTTMHTHVHSPHIVAEQHTSHDASMQRKWAKVTHSLSYMQTHAPDPRRTHTFIHGHSHRPQKRSHCRQTCGQPHISFRCSVHAQRKSHAQELKLARYAVSTQPLTQT